MQKDERTIKEIAAMFFFFSSLSRLIKQDTVVSFKVPQCSAVGSFVVRKIFKVRAALTLYVKEEVGANKGEDHH